MAKAKAEAHADIMLRLRLRLSDAEANVEAKAQPLSWMKASSKAVGSSLHRSPTVMGRKLPLSAHNLSPAGTSRW